MEKKKEAAALQCGNSKGKWGQDANNFERISIKQVTLWIGSWLNEF
jgi:hypothetical protein